MMRFPTTFSLLILSCLVTISCNSQSPAAAKLVGSWRSKEFVGLTCEFKNNGKYHATWSSQQGATVFADGRYSIDGSTFRGEEPDITDITGSNDPSLKVLIFGVIKKTNPPKATIAWKSEDEFTLTSRNEVRGADESWTWLRQQASDAKQFYQSQTPDRSGDNLEIRLLAVRPSADGPQTGEDIFPAANADKLSESGEAPTGWLWMPVMYSRREQDSLPTVAVQRAHGGQLYALVADQPSNTLTHRTDTPRWAVNSAKVVEDVSSVSKLVGVEVKLDGPGGRLLKDLSSRYTMHYLAIAIGGQIVMAPRVKSELEGTFDIYLGVGDLTEMRRSAKELQDRLLSQTGR